MARKSVITSPAFIVGWLAATVGLCVVTWAMTDFLFKFKYPASVLPEKEVCPVIEDQQSIEYFQTKIDGSCPGGCFTRTAVECAVNNNAECYPRENWNTMYPKPCPMNSKLKEQCAIPRYGESIQRFRNSRLDKKTVFEWLNLYAPGTDKRFEVVTTLLLEAVDPVVEMSLFHNAQSGFYWYRPYTNNCTFCKDTYQYIECVMTNNLTGNAGTGTRSQRTITTYPKKNVNDPNDLLYMEKQIEWILRDGPKKKIPEHINQKQVLYDVAFSKFELIQKAFNVKTQDGFCNICTDYNNDWSGYDPCM